MVIRQWVFFRRRSDLPRVKVASIRAILSQLVILLVLWLLPAAAAVEVAVVDTRTVVDAYYKIMNEPGLDPNTPIGPAPQELRKVEDELQRLKAQYARERAGLSPEAKAAYEKALLEKTAALQALYAKNWRDVVDVVKWRSPDILIPHLMDRIKEYALEQGFALVLNEQTGGALFRRDGWSGSSSDPIEVTQLLIDWLRRKEESARPPRPAGQ